MLQALGQLPEEQREVVALRVYASLRFPVIARHQGVSVNTAEGRYRYGMAKLRQCLPRGGVSMKSDDVIPILNQFHLKASDSLDAQIRDEIDHMPSLSRARDLDTGLRLSKWVAPHPP